MKVVIVGGGIAGLSAAIALRKNGREIVVLEQSSLNQEIGATISLQPNAAKIVEQTWDMKQLLFERGAMVDEGFQVYSLDGHLQISIPLKTTEKFGAERLIFHRADLHEALKHRATATEFSGEPAKIITSNRVVSCDCDKGIVKMQDGTELKGDLIIGADGIKSVIRKEVLGRDVPALKTGNSAYRMVVGTSELEHESEFMNVVDAKKPFTTMVMAHNKRLIMGPARNGSIYRVVAMVPDETMNESSENSSWTTAGDLNKMLQTFADFPDWAKAPLRTAKEAGLWQLRDIDPLSTWVRGRTVLIGDAAHAMLPTQGQGASQSIEDAEAIGAFFADVGVFATAEEVEQRNLLLFECRAQRASLIQAYSRETAKPATNQGENRIKMNPAEFMDYNCQYEGAVVWLRKQRKLTTEQDETLNKTVASLAIAVNG